MLESKPTQKLNPLQRLLALFRFSRTIKLTSTNAFKTTTRGSAHIIAKIYSYIESKFATNQIVMQSAVTHEISTNCSDRSVGTRKVSNINYPINQPSATDQSGSIRHHNNQPITSSTPTVVVAMILIAITALFVIYIRRRNRLATQQNIKIKTAQTATILQPTKFSIKSSTIACCSSNDFADYDEDDDDNLFNMEQELEERVRNASARKVNSSSRIKRASGQFSFESAFDVLPLQLHQSDTCDRKSRCSSDHLCGSSMTHSDSSNEPDLMFESSLTVNTARSITANSGSGDSNSNTAELDFHVCFAADKDNDVIRVCTRKGVLRREFRTQHLHSSRTSSTSSATGTCPLTHSPTMVFYDLRVLGEDGKARRAWLQPEDLTCSRGGAALLGPSENLPIEVQEVAAAGLLNSRSITLKVARRGALVLLCPSVRTREALLVQLTQDTKRFNNSDVNCRNYIINDSSETGDSTAYSTVSEDCCKQRFDESHAFTQLLRASQFLERTAIEMKCENRRALADLSESVWMHKNLTVALQQQVNALRLTGSTVVESGAGAELIRERDCELAELRRVLQEQVEANAAFMAARKELLNDQVIQICDCFEIAPIISPTLTDIHILGQDFSGCPLGMLTSLAVATTEAHAVVGPTAISLNPNSSKSHEAPSMTQTLEASECLTNDPHPSLPEDQPQVSDSESACSVDDQLTVASTILQRLSLELTELQYFTGQQKPSQDHRALLTKNYTTAINNVDSCDHQLVCRMPQQLRLLAQTSSTASLFGSQVSKFSKLSKLSQTSGITNTSSRPVSVTGNSAVTSESASRRKTNMKMRHPVPWTKNPSFPHTGSGSPFVVTKPRSNVEEAQPTHKVSKLSRMIKMVE